MAAKHLVIGLDGADLDIVHALGPTKLPHLHAAMARGVASKQRSVMPPATLPNWTTFLTGVDPARHGVFDFTSRTGYSVRFTGGTVREVPTLMRRLDRMGKRCVCLSFPGTYPPEQLDHGVFISGWDAPVAFEDDTSFVWPNALHAKIQARYGATRFDDVNEFDADAPGWHDKLADALVARIRRKVELAKWLMAGHGSNDDLNDGSNDDLNDDLNDAEWDLFAVYFGESDTVSHHLWAHHDRRSPRHLAARTADAARAGFTQVYAALDEAVGELLAAAGQDGGEDVELTILSDHGSGGSGDVVLYLNRVLADAGLLKFRSPTGTERLRSQSVQWLKTAALTLLPPRVRQRLFELRGAALPSLLESNARFGGIDMAHTQAFSDELNYFPGVCLNIQGREPDGCVSENDKNAVIREVQRLLLALRDPWNGQPVVREVWRREELFDGPYLERAPDLLLGFHLREGYSYNVMPTASAPAGTGPWRRLTPDEFHGRKGRSLAGSHRDHGLFIAAGPQIAAAGRIESFIADASATLLARMGIAVPPEFAGRVLYEVLVETGGMVDELPRVEKDEADVGRGGEAAIEARLRALGYID